MLHFGKIPKKFGQRLAKFNVRANFAKFQILGKKNSTKFNNF